LYDLFSLHSIELQSVCQTEQSRKLNEKDYLWRRDAFMASNAGDDLAEEDGDFSEKTSHLDKPMTIWKAPEQNQKLTGSL
jgi:hypothetical protein